MGTESPERRAVSEAYSGDKWREKVKKMSNEQVVAVYMRLKLQGRIK